MKKLYYYGWCTILKYEGVGCDSFIDDEDVEYNQLNESEHRYNWRN